MKTIGIIGGLGPEATIDYYKEIIKGFNAINNNGSMVYPEIVIFSVNMDKFIGFLEAEKFTEATNYIADCINNLGKAGVDFAAISANTPHMLFHEIQKKTTVPLISIVEACALKAKEMGLKKCGLIGTKFTMKSTFFAEVFSRQGVDIVVPNADQMNLIHEKLFTEMELGIFNDETKIELLTIVNEMKTNTQIDSLILGCTEFPIMFTENEYLNIPFLNTTKIHVDAIIKTCLNGSSDN